MTKINTFVTAEEREAIIPSLGYNYLLLKVEGPSLQGDEWCVRIGNPSLKHRQILSMVEEEFKGRGLSVKAAGGGKLAFSPDKTTVTLFGRSADFGREHDRGLTASVIQKEVPDFTVEVKD